MRAAEKTVETDHLALRLKNAETSTEARGCKDVLNNFGLAVDGAMVSISNNLSQLKILASDDNELYKTFYQEVASEARLPENNKWDRGRGAVDSTLFPNYPDDIRFGALTLTGRGVEANYGGYSMVLKNFAIISRTTFFEENTFLFVQRHKIIVGEPIPPGYRATWKDRSTLAKAKLHSKLDRTKKPHDYPGILLSQGGSPERDDFIEAHIYGPIHRRALEKVIGPAPQKPADKILWRALKRKLEEIGVQLEAI